LTESDSGPRQDHFAELFLSDGLVTGLEDDFGLAGRVGAAERNHAAWAVLAEEEGLRALQYFDLAEIEYGRAVGEALTELHTVDVEGDRLIDGGVGRRGSDTAEARCRS